MPFIKPMIFVLLFIGIIFFGINYFNGSAEKHSDSWYEDDLNHLNHAKKLRIFGVKEGADSLAAVRLQEQYEQTKYRAKSHLKIVRYYYARHYMAISIAALSGIAAAICLFFITNIGWGGSSFYLKLGFLLASSAAALYGSFPTLFSQRENIEANKYLYSSYIDLENRILTYAATGTDSKAELVHLNSFLHIVDQRFAELHKIDVNLNHEGVSEIAEKAGASYSNATTKR